MGLTEGIVNIKGQKPRQDGSLQDDEAGATGNDLSLALYWELLA